MRVHNTMFIPHACCLLLSLFSFGSSTILGEMQEFNFGQHTSCQTVPTTVHVIKEEYEDNGIIQRTCEADIAVNKCEGSCFSHIQPSVHSISGFIKDCSCCRETELRKRVLLLSKCYNSDGIQLLGTLATMKVSIREPIECHCVLCQEREK